MLCSCLAGVNGLNSGPWVLVEDLSSVYNDVEVAVKHAHKKRKLTDGREKTMASPNQKSFLPECSEEIICYVSFFPSCLPFVISTVEFR